MIKGLLNWQDIKRYCDQSNNPNEKSRKDAVNDMIDRIQKDHPSCPLSAYKNRGYLGSCNVESVYTGMDCRGDIDKFGNPKWQGIDCDPAGFMFEHLNWTRYDSIYQKGDAMDNEYIYSLEKMLKKMGYITEVVKYPDPSYFKKHLHFRCTLKFGSLKELHWQTVKEAFQ